jgi:hypothetical protein
MPMPPSSQPLLPPPRAAEIFGTADCLSFERLCSPGENKE